MNDKELKEQLKKEMLDLCETNSSVMTYMECLMRKYENLQSKIDKAIELGDKIIQEYEELVGLTGNLVLNFKQVLNILKEDK